jgi:hypothetical protein
MRLGALAVCLVFAADPTLPDANDGIEPLLGVWCLIATADARHTDAGSAACTMTIDAEGRVVMRLGELVTNEGTIQVRRAGRLRWIDLNLKTGQVLGVYELRSRGTALAICCDEAGKSRPDGLEPRGTRWVEHWQRVRQR